jgi:hypothetical protein
MQTKYAGECKMTINKVNTSLLVLLFLHIGVHNIQGQDQKVIKKWKKAVVHLECATDKYSFSDLMTRFQKSEISWDSLNRLYIAGSRLIRFQGTAIFLEHQNHYYIFTARHVLYDTNTANAKIREEMERLKDAPASWKESSLQSTIEQAQTSIFSIIFLVPSLEEIVRNNSNEQGSFLMNVGAGPYDLAPYTFSIPEIDLAVISLRRHDLSVFADSLRSKGHIPIRIDDIADEPKEEGADVFSVGYPQATAILGKVQMSFAEWQWCSNLVSVPNFVFGKVGMKNDLLQYFWCDMSVYPGNSGGPVIEDGKMVGIVSAQPVISDEIIEFRNDSLKSTSYYAKTRVPFARVIKAKYINPKLSLRNYS